MKRVILNSGGIDSLALAIKCKDDELHSLHVHIGVPSSDAQAEAAEKIANEFCASHKVIEVHGLLTPPPEGGPLKPLSYNTPTLAMLGSSYAMIMGIVSVISGNRNERVNKDFEKYFTRMLQTHVRDERVYSRPLGSLKLEDVYQIVKEHPLFPQTVSCLSYPPCGTCPKCQIRKNYGIDV
ncbi:hypothetical protein [Geobacter sp. SVR]|uniref:hypothetical protein n=1 Tax=Geobacter sp. SVR TaxID=2495594 RepID=UPI00143F047E|nr:hypothetical protein [Geobacter sp. SVR]BCS54056.1 hypothetical protein GSVR_23640 [Geobacter sp. SVR]GCF87539.1 hypothetical protein GSbR_41390 [Geobacter sp. SVR]